MQSGLTNKQQCLEIVPNFDYQRLKNINLQVLHAIKRIPRYVAQYIENHQYESGIIYTATCEEAEAIADYLFTRGIKVVVYHSKMMEKARHQVQEAFQNGQSQVIVTTSNSRFKTIKIDVRFILHLVTPQSLDAYWQEINNLAQDGGQGEAVLIFRQTDLRNYLYYIEKRNISDREREKQFTQLQAVGEYANTTRCLLQELVGYFGQSCSSCKQCCNCLNEDELEDITALAQTVISTVKLFHGQYGKLVTAQILAGSKAAKMKEINASIYENYGELADYSQCAIMDLLDYLVATKYLRMKQGQYLLVTDLGQQVLENKKIVKKQRASFIDNKKKLVNGNKELFEALRQKRLELAKEERVAAYIIFNNATLNDMARILPQTAEEFLLVKGIGEIKLTRYGEAMMGVIKEYIARHPEINDKKLLAG